MVDQYDPLALDYDPLALDYDPLAAGAYQHYIQPSAQQAPEYQAQTSTGPSSFKGGEIPSAFVPFQDYAAMRGNDDQIKVYDDYVNTVLPSYLSQLGLTLDQQALEIAEFRKVLPPPNGVIPERTWTEALVSDPLVSLARAGNALLKAGNWVVDIVSPESWDKTRREWLVQNEKDLDALKSDSLRAREGRQERANKEGPWAAVSNAATDPVILSSMIIESLPSMAVPIGAAGRAGTIALERALASGMTRKAAESVASTVAKRWSMIGEGAVTGAGVGAKVDEALDKADITDTSERLKWSAVALPAGVITAAIGKFSPVEASLFTSKLITQGVPEKLIPAIVKNAGKEAVEEYLQSANEGYWGNIGSKQLDLNDPKAWDGVAVDAALGALVGGVAGGSLGGLGRKSDVEHPSNTGGREEQTPVEVTQPDAARGEMSLSDTLDEYGDKPETATAPEAQVQTQEAQNGSEETEPVREVQQGQSNGQEAQGQGRQQEGRSSGQDQVQGPTERVQTVPESQGQKEVTGRQSVTESAQPGQSQEADNIGAQSVPTLPKDLAGAKPRYAYQSTNYNLKFTNDVDRALYIVGRSKKLSNADNDYLTWLQNEVYPNETENQIRGRGQVVAQAIRTTASSAPSSSKVLTVPRYFKSSRPQPTIVSGGGEAALAERVAPTKTIAATQAADTTQAGAQVLEDLQVPDDPQLTAEVAEEMITRLSDAVEQSSNPSQAAAFVAAETESPTTGPIETSQASTSAGGKRVRRTQRDQSTAPIKKRIGKSSPAVNIEGVDSGVEAVRAGEPGQSSGRAVNTERSQSSDSQSVAEGRDEVLNPPEDTRIPAKDAELQRLSAELSTLPTEEAKQLANYLYNEFDVGFGQPYVDRAKLVRARAVVAESKQAYKLKKLGVRDNPEVVKLFTDPVTGEVFDSRVVRTTFEQEPLGMGVKSFLAEGNLTGALQGLYLNGSTPLVRAVAGRLANLYMGNVKVKIVKLGKTNNGMQIGGQWSPSTLELRLDPVHGLTEHVLLHEAIHAATVQGIRNAKTAEQKAAVQELSALFVKAQKTLDPKQYAFTNLAEFVAETFANPDLQYQMYQIKEEGQQSSLWQRFINAVTKLVGLDNLLGRTMNVAEALFMAPIADGDIRGTFAATVAPQPNTGPIDITVKRTGKGYSWFFDREAATLNLGKQIHKAFDVLGLKMPDAMNLKFQNVLKRSQAEAALRKWTEAHWNDITGSVQNVMKQHGRSVEEIEKFLEQQQVLGRAEQKIKEFDPTNTNYAEQVRKAQDALNEADKYLVDIETNNPTYFKSMLGVMNKIKAATDANLDARMAARNNMTAARLSSMKNAFPSRYMPNGFYIPLQLDNNDGTQVALMKQSLGQNFKAEQPLSRIYAQAALTAYANEANTEKQQVLALAKQLNLTDEFTGKPLIEIGPVGKLKRDANTGEITEGQDNLLLDKDSVGVWVDGSYIKMRINDPNLRESLGPIAVSDMPQAIGLAIGAARHFTQLMSVTRTAINPGFTIYNFLRDQGAAAIQLDPKIRYGAFYAALPLAISSGFYNTFSGALGGKQSAKYLKALDDGAFISQRSYVGLTDTIRDVQQDLAPTLRGKLKAGLVDPFSTKVGQILTAFSQSLETATRLAIYDAAIASGLSPKEAAYHAKTTTTNFERKSNFTNAVGPFYMFVNAKTQGTRTLIDKAVGIDANPRTQVALGSLVALGLIAAALGYDKSEKDKDGISKYFKIADYKRDSRVIVKEGTPGIPMPQEASLFYVLGNAIGDVVMGPATVGQGLSRFVKNLIQQAAPLGSGQTDPTARNTVIADYLMRLFLPSMAHPVYDIATNRDTFGQPVVPESLRFTGKSNHEKYTRNENPTSIALAKAMYEGDYADVSPAQLTHIAKFLEGGAVTFWRDMFNPKEPSYEGQSTNPLGKRFTSEAVPYGDDEAYKNARDELKRSFEKARSGSMAERGQAYNQNKEAIGLYNRFKAFDDFKTRQLFRGYSKMDADQAKRAGLVARDRQMQLMRDYYRYKGIVKD